jgi:hypothetical protein
VSNFKNSTVDTVEAEDEQVQQSEKEDSGLDINIYRPHIRESFLSGGVCIDLIYDTS